MAEDAIPNEEYTQDDEGTTEFDTPMDQFFYHQRRALEETAKALDALLPPGFKEHGANAGREFKTGFKVLLDAAIEELKTATERAEAAATEAMDDIEEEFGSDRPSTTGTTKVRIEVE
jgi:hypothetical protein